MKVIYLSSTPFADCDFPLVKEMQRQGIDVRYYIRMPRHNRNTNILEFSKPWKKWGIYRASNMVDMLAYKDCVDLNRLYFISGYTLHWWNVSSWILWIYAMIHILLQRADVWHITWQLNRYERFLYHMPFRGKRIMTVHDPIQHSGLKNHDKNEKARLRSFRWADEFILLNKAQKDEFRQKYNISPDRIHLSHLGAYDSIIHIQVPESPVRKPYIMFFGQVNPNKGIEYLTEAMVRVHKKHPDVSLLIAGKGDIYFDTAPYKSLDYIIWENRFIGIKELVSYVRGCQFVVCPYKDATQSGVVQTAFALETPVIATNVGGLPAAVKDGVYGTIVPPCDSNTLADAILDLLDNPAQIVQMVQNIKEKWLPSMSWEPVAEDYYKVYSGYVAQ